MPDTEIKLWTAVIAALVSLLIAVFSHFSTRRNQIAIEKLRDQTAERSAKRDYEYDARKRLYEQCGPIIFQLTELCESAYFRITGLAGTARQGNLEPGRDSYLRDEYYRTSTLYRLLAPSAALKLLQRRLTLVDLSLDAAIWRQYELARQALFSFGGEFEYARLGTAIDYKPFDKEADQRAKSNPATYHRQGLPLGVIESAVEALLVTEDDGDLRVLTYAECEAEFEKQKSRVRQQFDEIRFLVDDFHPRSRPVFWRLLVTQACLYRAIVQQDQLRRPEWSIADLQIPIAERKKFDWRSQKDGGVVDDEVFEPLGVALEYLDERLTPRLARIAAVSKAN
jgi:hypothetical protein